MRTARLLPTFLVLSALFFAPAALAAPPDPRALQAARTAAEFSEHRVALVIGNAQYKDAPLKNPVNDARAIAKTLRGLGFDVIERVNVTQKEMNRAITEFGSRLRQDSVALFYYAGHGMQAKGRNYLIPVDAEIASEISIKSESVDVDTVIEQIGGNNNGLNFVILDACRNNPFERRFRSSAGSGLAQMDAPKGTLVAYSTAPGKTANDGSGENGLYTQELLKVLPQPGLRVEEVFKRVRVAVAKTTNDNQLPWESSSLTGDFFFGGTPKASAAKAEQATAAQKAAEVESEWWRAAQKADSVDAYNAYLGRYPDGPYATLARSIVASRLQAQQAASAQDAKEAEVWKSTQQIGTREAYAAYLDEYPKGRFASLAKTMAATKDAEQRKVAQAAAREDEVWKAAQQLDSSDGYQAYLDEFPQGKFIRIARAGLKKAQEKEAAAKVVQTPIATLGTGKQVATAKPTALGGLPNDFSVPREGDVWVYQVKEEHYRKKVIGEIDIKVDKVRDGSMREMVGSDGPPTTNSWTTDSRAGLLNRTPIRLEGTDVIFFDINPYKIQQQLAAGAIDIGDSRCTTKNEGRIVGSDQINTLNGKTDTKVVKVICQMHIREMKGLNYEITLWYGAGFYRPLQMQQIFTRSWDGGVIEKNTYTLVKAVHSQN